MTDFLDEFAAYEAKHGQPDRIELLLPDINAIHRGKWLPGNDAKKLVSGAVRLPLSTYAPNIMGEDIPETGLGLAIGDPDGIMMPVPGTLKPVPWADGHVAQVQCEMGEDGETISDLSTRGKLAAMVDRFAARGLKPVIASELEFYLLTPRETPEEAPCPPPHAPEAQNYELNVLDRTQEILTEIQQACAIQGLATDSLIAEYGPGQYEINFHHTDDVLEAADTAVLFRRLVRGVVQRHDMEATFMAKPYAEHPGNGMHVHVSVADESGNIFRHGGDGCGGIADTLGFAVAGVLETMAESQAVLAPHMNSFRRFAPGSFSPNLPDWGIDHRGAAIRLPDTEGPAARLEHRIGGADCNPYLAITAILGGVLYGLDRKLPPPLPIEDPNWEEPAPLGHDWRHAVDAFAASAFIRDIFGESFQHIYATLKYDEIAKLTSEITTAEYRVYLGRL
ncbi:glutamine synthetase family protein [Pseudoruegeria sp. HB172150]|uniref:glutamine synthetase family protein n=1 Tax=Pseudoruegeria sp. HB172150 TaxID=2721164 RepID=UPI001555D1F3|nr:glutamine synthetase family protein [Pseudoruegeria sp. HB172150]